MGESRATLAIEDVRFAYGKSTTDLFGGLSHEFGPGTVTAVTAPSGRGKSTLLYILGLMLTPTAGEVIFNGRPISGLPDAERSSVRNASIGFVFQDAALDPRRTLIDNVVEPALYRGDRRKDAADRALTLLDSVGLSDHATKRPTAISGGQAQRVAFCRALVNGPSVILADEPTGNLDPDNSERLLTLLRAAAHRGSTVVIATHDPRVVDRADARWAI